MECGILFSRQLFGDSVVDQFLKDYPEIFIFASLCSWAYLSTGKGNGLNAKEGQLFTFVSTLLAVGYPMEVCDEVIKACGLDTYTQATMMTWVRNIPSTMVVYVYSPEVQGCTVH